MEMQLPDWRFLHLRDQKLMALSTLNVLDRVIFRYVTPKLGLIEQEHLALLY